MRVTGAVSQPCVLGSAQELRVVYKVICLFLSACLPDWLIASMQCKLKVSAMHTHMNAQVGQ